MRKNNLKYPLIVSDFDGTLTRADGTVPEENIAAIAKFRKAGGIFTVATGRMYGSIQKQLAQLGLTGGGKELPVISLQGALIKDANTGRILHSVTLDRQIAKRAITYCKERNIYCHFYSFDNFFIEKHTEFNRKYAEYTQAAELKIFAGDLLLYLDSHPEIPISKVLIIDEKDKIAGIQAEINAYFGGEAVFVRSADNLTECVEKAAGKGSALLWLSEYYKIPIQNILAIGDSGNDASMLAVAGLGVAMGNAEDALKRIAGYITDRSDNAGLAKVIDMVLNGEL